MHLQAPGIRSISRAASVRHCAEDLATAHSGTASQEVFVRCFVPLADLTEICSGCTSLRLYSGQANRRGIWEVTANAASECRTFVLDFGGAGVYQITKA